MLLLGAIVLLGACTTQAQRQAAEDALKASCGEDYARMYVGQEEAQFVRCGISYNGYAQVMSRSTYSTTYRVGFRNRSVEYYVLIESGKVAHWTEYSTL
tara:strand:- start:665 stop:961 length:297 start_codon:yes stop_codon:yes gene_type:complete